MVNTCTPSAATSRQPRFPGVNTKRTKIIIYVMAAALYALGGYLVGAKSGGASVNMGNGWELEAIAACTIGGVP